jgi:hypothetical protein
VGDEWLAPFLKARPTIWVSLSKSGQPFFLFACNSLLVNGEIEILAVELDGHDGLLVTFSDGTVGGYLVEELPELRPVKKVKNAHLA